MKPTRKYQPRMIVAARSNVRITRKIDRPQRDKPLSADDIDLQYVEIQRKERAAAACKRSRERMRKAMEADPEHPKHGTTTGYTYGCRCERCTSAHTEAVRRRVHSPHKRSDYYGSPKSKYHWKDHDFEIGKNRKNGEDEDK